MSGDVTREDTPAYDKTTYDRPPDDALGIARKLLRMQSDLRLAVNHVTRELRTIQELTDDAYRLAGYEKKDDGEYGPPEEAG